MTGFYRYAQAEPDVVAVVDPDGTEVTAGALLARANQTGKKVYGFDSNKGSCAEMPRGGIAANWDFACVEGDSTWTRLPREEDA